MSKLYIMQPGDCIVGAGSHRNDDGTVTTWDAHCLTAKGKRIPWGQFASPDTGAARRAARKPKRKRRAAKA